MSYTTWSCRFFYVMYLALALGWMLKPKELLAALAYKVGGRREGRREAKLVFGACVVERVVVACGSPAAFFSLLQHRLGIPNTLSTVNNARVQNCKITPKMLLAGKVRKFS